MRNIMEIYLLALEFKQLLEAAMNRDDLAHVMAAITARLDFDHFAMTQHIDTGAYPNMEVIHIHNYPTRWADFYAEAALGPADPVHRASQRIGHGFLWARIPSMIGLTELDQRILALGRAHGIGDGFTVPSNLAGSAHGSCTFIMPEGRVVSQMKLLVADVIGGHAFERARQLVTGPDRGDGPPRPVLTDRQRECVIWTWRGKSDWEVGQILNISEETVTRHIKDACQRYGVNKRISLIARCLVDGTLTISDLTRWRYTPFWA